MKVRDLMRTSVVTVEEDDDLALAVQLMAWNGLRHLAVVSNDRLVGVLSERDIIARHRKDSPSIAGKVLDAMSVDPDTIGPQADLEEAAAKLGVGRHGCLPVVDDGWVVGIITTSDLLAEMAQLEVEPAPAGAMLDRDVESIMTSRVVAVYEDDALLEAGARMHQYGIRHLPVIDGMRRVVGMLSERDVLRTVGDLRLALEAPTARVAELRIRDAMTPEPRTVQRSDPLAQVASILADERYGALPVVDGEDRLEGMVSYVDVLRALRQIS